MLRPAEADALGAELPCLRGVLGRVRVRAHPQAADLVRPAEQRLEVLVDLRRDERHLADDHLAGAAVDREDVALCQLVLAEADAPRVKVDRERLAARHARLAHPAGDNRRVRGHAAVSGEHSARLDDAVDVVGRRLGANEDDRLPASSLLLGAIGVEHDLAGRGARRGVQPLGGDLELGARVDHRVEQLVELGRVDPRDRLLLRQQALRDHVDRDAKRGSGRALPGAGLEQVEAALLDGELDVLHLAVVLLERRHRRTELVERGGKQRLHGGDRLGRADARDDVLPLRVDEELAPEARLAGRRVAREGDAGAGVVPLVPEHHLHDVHRRAEVVRDPVGAPVHLRARRLPRIEDGADGPFELVASVLGEVGVELLEAGHELPQIVARRARRPA